MNILETFNVYMSLIEENDKLQIKMSLKQKSSDEIRSLFKIINSKMTNNTFTHFDGTIYNINSPYVYNVRRLITVIYNEYLISLSSQSQQLPS